jgi:hypothetical protein
MMFSTTMARMSQMAISASAQRSPIQPAGPSSTTGSPETIARPRASSVRTSA